MQSYDAVLLVSFGGPETREDVLPFLENVLRGRNVPRERMLEVAEHYYHFGGKSPINDQNRQLLTALRLSLQQSGPALPVYWGNRNWDPLLSDVLQQMTNDGIRRALAFVTSAYSSYSGCRQYREDIQKARDLAGPEAPVVDKLRAFYNHPGFIEPVVSNVRLAIQKLGPVPVGEIQFLFTAHSVPLSMAAGSAYAAQIAEAARIVSETLWIQNWSVVWQSRSGPPSQPWLEPDVGDFLRSTVASHVVVVPIGFLSDHMEVLYDLDVEAADICRLRGISMARAATVGAHPRFVEMIRELIRERMESAPTRPALGLLGPSHDVCGVSCCPPPMRPTVQRIVPA